ncbi:helix-turn-helix transcriptional regulator [Halobacillus karajensis]|uniref:Helix-turn-helix n=1 Tax=Halobacillus karajensis TaxID=195088 RepID=A0A059NYQ7_9BACI|nr:helix-turn-helix transcriptional regulator [Halobacillus karajensis]CDQ22632.1 Helix-turn-helix [Halobacillus karajensis]CDQ26114.1 Helix-turn-helix [Halobacillus karajensis]
MYINLYIKRREARITKKDLAEEMGIWPETYGKKENGKQDFTLREAKFLAKKFNCTLDELFGEVINESA